MPRAANSKDAHPRKIIEVGRARKSLFGPTIIVRTGFDSKRRCAACALRRMHSVRYGQRYENGARRAEA